MYYDKELKLIDKIKKTDKPSEEIDSTIDGISECFTNIQKIATYVDLFVTNRTRTEKEFGRWEENFKKARIAIKEVNGICSDVKFPKIFPDKTITDEEIYEIGSKLEDDVFKMTEPF